MEPPFRSKEPLWSHLFGPRRLFIYMEPLLGLFELYPPLFELCPPFFELYPPLFEPTPLF